MTGTPRMTVHARTRCQEMGVRTRTAKAVVRDHTVSWVNADGQTVATSDQFPDITVVYQDGEPPEVITVLWREAEQYDRDTYVPRSQRA